MREVDTEIFVPAKPASLLDRMQSVKPAETGKVQATARVIVENPKPEKPSAASVRAAFTSAGKSPLQSRIDKAVENKPDTLGLAKGNTKGWDPKL